MLTEKENDPEASPVAAPAPAAQVKQEPQSKKPSKEEIARAIRLRNSNGRYSELTPADLDIARKLSYSAALENEVDPAHKVQVRCVFQVILSCQVLRQTNALVMDSSRL